MATRFGAMDGLGEGKKKEHHQSALHDEKLFD